MSAPYLSIVIPAHNEENRLPATLQQVVDFVTRQPYACEVLVVENGSRDRTWEILQTFTGRYPFVHGLQEQVPGKGLAVRRGMLAARGAYRFMCDADLSMPVSEILRFLPPAQSDYDLAIGSREAPGAIRYNEPAYRHWGGRVINGLIRLLVLPGMQDTQCGFKCFRAEVAADLFGCQRIPGWAFDIEVLYIARRRGYRIVEIPIPWHYNPESKLNIFNDTLQMLRDILRIRRNARLGYYDYHPNPDPGTRPMA
ncbi:MAG: glycosyltransferase family 2 protein [Anaerolineales bacterium]